MPCIFDVKPEDRHCKYCTATICDERQPKPVETFVTNKIDSMTDKEKLEAIRAEIHRLVDVRGYDREMADDLFAFMDSLPNEPKDKCQGCNNVKGCVTCVDGSEWAHYHYEEPVSDELEEAANAYISNETNYSHSRTDTFKAGAKWKEEQFEKNRIEHCEGITEEQYNLETKFLDLYIKRFNRLPTILDAIEYGKTLGEMLMIGEAVETTFNVSLPSSLYDKLKAKGCEDGDKLLIIKKED